jgi:5-aminolevulinate synthase
VKHYSLRALQSPWLGVTATPYHDDVLIDQLAEALTDVWRRVALPLEGCVIDAAE